MPDLEERLRFLEALSTHQTFTANTPLEPKQREEFNEIKPQACLADFLRGDSNFLTQRKLILHQEALQLQHRPVQGKRLQGIDGVEGKDVLLLQPERDESVLNWPQFSNEQLRMLISKRQNALLMASNRSQAKRRHASPLFWSTLLLKRSKKEEKRLKSDPSYVLHLAKLAVIDEQPRRALALLQTGLVSSSLLRKQSLRSQVNLVFLYALQKGFEEVCLFLMECGFPSSLFNPIFAGNTHPRRFPSYFLVAVALKREGLVHWGLNQGGVGAGHLNRAWFNGLRPLLVAQWSGSFGVTEALLKRGAGADRSISYLTYLRCRSYFLTSSEQGMTSSVRSITTLGTSRFELYTPMGMASLSNASHSSSSLGTSSFELFTPMGTVSRSNSSAPVDMASLSNSSHSSSSKLPQGGYPHRNRLKRLKLFSIDLACATGRFEAARLLLQSMPLEAVEQNDFCLLLLPEASLAMALLKRCPKLATKQRDWQGNTPLHLAARAGRLDLMTIYLQYSIGVDALNGSHSTALHEAASACNRAAVQWLISRGADCSIVDEGGQTALQVARRAGISSEELIDFFHAADTLKQTSASLSQIIKECTETVDSKESKGESNSQSNSESNSQNNSESNSKSFGQSNGQSTKKSQKRFLFQKLFGKWRR